MTRIFRLNGLIPQTFVALAAAAALALAGPDTASGQGRGRGGQSGGGQRSGDGGSGRGGPADGGSGRAVPRGGPRAEGGSHDGQREGSTRSGGGGPRARNESGGDRSANAAPPDYSRRRDGRTPTGQVAERGRRGGSGTTVIVNRGGYYGGFYPWGYGGLGFAGYYGGFYEPWWYDPYATGYGYGAYDNGALRLKVKPRDASVYVDGYFAGTVDDYDGVFQRLRIEPGPHRVEIRLDGYEPLSFEVLIQPDRTVNYAGELRRLP